MANQKEVAKALGITQAAVSLALRGSRRISADMRKKVCDTAEQLGYHPNSYLTVLMSNIRNGKTLNEKGAIGLLIEARSQKDWYEVETYRVFHQGVLQRSRELGFHAESFFMKAPGMQASRIEQILQARGITGIILAPPYHGNLSLGLHWERYAAIGVGFGWEKQELNLVGYDHIQNYMTAFNELRRQGYKRIGTALADAFVSGSRRGIKWYTGYLECQNSIEKNNRIPVFAHIYPPPGGNFHARLEEPLVSAFRKWVLKWKPDAIISLVGIEKEWLNLMGLNVPQDIGIACLARPPGSDYAGIEDKGSMIGAIAVEMVTAQIARNEFGPPAC